jgi:amidase
MFLRLNRLIESEATTIDDSYYAALTKLRELGRSGGIDGLLEKYKLDAILIPMNCECLFTQWRTD